MKRTIAGVLAVGIIAILSLGFFVGQVTAEGEDTSENVAGTSIRLSPANFVVQLPPDSVIEDTFEIKNEGKSEIKVQVYTSPYSYVYSSDEDQYKLGFSNENNFTQLSRWITFEDSNGDYVAKPTFTIEADETLDVKYRITTPASMPGGGQYAVIFAHTLTSVTAGNGIKTEASPGIVVYGHSTEGENIISAGISNLTLGRGIAEANVTRDNIYATAKVKNNGNVDFIATGTLKVDPIIGFSSYENPNGAKVSIIPEAELKVYDEWKDTPSFGIYRATWKVIAGNEEETIEQVFFLFSPVAIIGAIILLTFLIICVIILIRKRKERRSRLAI